MCYVTACSNGGSNSKDGESPTAANVPKDWGPAEISIVGLTGDGDETSDSAQEELSKRFPNYTFTFLERIQPEKVKERIAGGTQMDIVSTSIGEILATVINPDLQFDIGELIKKHNVDLNRFDPAPLDAMKSMTGGKLYGLPRQNNLTVLFYNKDLFDKFGVPYPKDGMTWDDALALAHKMTRVEGGRPYLGMSVATGHLLQTNQFSLPMVDPKTNKASAGNDAWKRIYQTIFIEPAADPAYRDWILSNKNKLPGKNQFLKDKNTAMLLDNFTFHSQLEAGDLNWDMVSLPTFKDHPGIGSQVYPKYLNITSTGKFKDQAMEVVAYLVSDEYQMKRSRLGDMTVLKNPEIQKALGSDTKFKGINLNALNYNKVAPASLKSLYDDIVLDEFQEVLIDVSLGKVDVNTALRNVQEAADKAIAANQ
jgi:multiple sugar transport system substrate-binding protein